MESTKFSETSSKIRINLFDNSKMKQSSVYFVIYRDNWVQNSEWVQYSEMNLKKLMSLIYEENFIKRIFISISLNR